MHENKFDILNIDGEYLNCYRNDLNMMNTKSIQTIRMCVPIVIIWMCSLVKHVDYKLCDDLNLIVIKFSTFQLSKSQNAFIKFKGIHVYHMSSKNNSVCDLYITVGNAVIL